MTLMILLCALGTEYFWGVLDDVRCFGWFSRYSDWFENKCVQSIYLDGAGGIIVLLASPLLLLLLLDCVLANLFSPLSYLLALAVLLYSMGPVFLNRSLTAYVDALDAEDDVQAGHYAKEFYHALAAPDPGADERDIIGCIFVAANERLYAVIFWFIVLGPFGALLYRLSSILKSGNKDIHGTYADAARHLNHILNWPSTRLFALGNALAGNLIEAIDAWRDNENGSFCVSETVLITSAFGALHYRPETEKQEDSKDKSDWIRASQALINRTLIVWLTVLGLMTIAGILI